MVSRAAALASFVLLGLAPAAFAVDLDSLSTRDRKIYCHAYIYLGLYLQREGGAITTTQMDTEMNRIARIVMNRGGNYGFTQANRTFARAIDVISAENPSPAQLSEQIETCRTYLKL